MTDWDSRRERLHLHQLERTLRTTRQLRLLAALAVDLLGPRRKKLPVLGIAHDPPYLLHGLEVTVGAKGLLVDDGGHGQAVEAVRPSLQQL